MFARDERGQVLILAALMFATLCAAAGLAIDVAASLQTQRALRNAADAAALVGAKTTLSGNFANIQRDIIDIAEHNGVPDPDGTAYDGLNSNVTWNYIDNSNATVTQANATGVSVTVTSTVPNRFMQLVGIATTTVTATARASVETLVALGGAPPFAVYEIQNSVDLLTHDAAGNVTGVNPAAAGVTYTIHSPSGPSAPPGGCLGGNSWKGLADTSATPPGVGGYAPLRSGSVAGPTQSAVRALGTSFVFLPIFDQCPAPGAHVVAYAVFDVQGSGNTHTGTLQSGQFLGVGSGSRTWSPGSSGLAATLKLVR